MQMLANIAGIKERDASEIKHLKKRLKAAQSFHKDIGPQTDQKTALVYDHEDQLREQKKFHQSTTSRIRELEEQIKAKDTDIQNLTQAAQASESSHSEDKSKAVAKWNQWTTSLEANLKTIVEERDKAQNSRHSH
jgi:hypothetical protein